MRFSSILYFVGCVMPLAAADDPAYPIQPVVAADRLFCVDLDLPGVWRLDNSPTVWHAGERLLRKPLNRPRCAAGLSDGSVLVGDSATREIYRIDPDGKRGDGLTAGRIGIPMTLLLDQRKTTVYVGDAERRSVFAFPVGGGEPELIARVNARGLTWRDATHLWAVTPDDAALVEIEIPGGAIKPILTGRPFGYPNNVVWIDNHAYVSDGYRKTIWRVDADGKTEAWLEGNPLVGPVGLAAGDGVLYVADPKTQQVHEIDLNSRAVKPRF